MTLQVQALTLLLLIGSGMLLGAVYDGYNVVLREWRFLRFLGPLLDFSFWIGSLILVFLLLLRINHADFRFYIYLILLLGWGIYRVTLRTLVIQSTVRLILAIGWVCLTIYKLFMLLIWNPIRWILRVSFRLLVALDRMLSNLEKIILWPFEFLINGFVTVLDWLLTPLLRPVINWISPYTQLIRKKWDVYLARWKEIKAVVSNWMIRKDDDDENRPPR